MVSMTSAQKTKKTPLIRYPIRKEIGNKPQHRTCIGNEATQQIPITIPATVWKIRHSRLKNLNLQKQKPGEDAIGFDDARILAS